MANKLVRIIGNVALIASLASCKTNTNINKEFDYQTILEHGYQDLSKRKLAEMQVDESIRFAIKAKETPNMFNAISPTEAPAENREEFRAAYEVLNLIKSSYGDILFPKATAAAQISYDCWITGTNAAPHSVDTENCRSHYYTLTNSILENFDDISFPEGDILVRADISFPINISNITTREQKNRLEEFTSELNGQDVIKIIIDGHADTTGSPEYNKAISKKRALRVKDELIKRGIDPNLIIVRSYGDTMPMFESGVNKKDPRNRVVRMMAIIKLKD